jgi:glycosyltransferase involved in cell wall biosynthesis
MHNQNIPTILYVANKRLPSNDYRILFGRAYTGYRIIYALPEMTPGLDVNRFVKIGFRESISIDDISNFYRLACYLARNKKHLSLTHYYSTKLILVGPILSAMLGIQSIVTLTGLGRTFVNRGPMFSILRSIYMVLMYISSCISQRILFQNYGDMQMLAQRLPQFAHKFAYIGSAVDMPTKTDRCYRSSKLRVLLVTRLMPTKGIGDFLEVAKELWHDHFEFVLVGPSSKGFMTLEERVKTFHEQGIIEYKGELDSKATQMEFEQAHIFYFPSMYGEGLARVMLECGFAGLCPIAYDIAANRDLVSANRGFLVATGDCEAVIDLLRYLEQHRDLIESNARAYQRYVVEYYSAATFAQRMNGILDELLTKTGALMNNQERKVGDSRTGSI